MSPLRVLSVLLVSLWLFDEAAASGVLVPRDGSPPIRVQSHRVTAMVADGIARTTVRQTFVNPHGRALEAVYLFPLPDGASLAGLAMETGGERLEGVLAERGTARRAYNAIVRRELDPALVEQIGASKFRLSVFPVLPDQPTVVELTWVEAVPWVGGECHYVYPLALGEPASVTEQDLTISVTMTSSHPLASIRSSDADVNCVRVNAHKATATLERSQATLDRDFVITAVADGTSESLGVHVHRDGTEHATFAAVVTPPALEEDQVLPRDITLAFDVSGSMKGSKFEQARAAARWLVDHVRPHDRVNLLPFNDTIARFAPNPVPVTDETRKALHSYLDTLSALGGTALGDAVHAAAQMPKEPGRVAMAIVLTDGRPTVGETRQEFIIASARSASERGVRLHLFGVGKDVAAPLLEAIATAGGGACEVFRPGGEIETRLQRFLLRTSAPAITDLRLMLGGHPVDDLLPRPLPDVYLGEQVVLTGRVRVDGEHEMVVEGVLGGAPLRLTQLVDFGTAESDAHGTLIARDHYAQSRLARLQQAQRLRLGLDDAAYFAALDRGAYSTRDELVEAQITLSLESGLQCPYTSFLALHEEDRQFLDPRDAEAIARAIERTRERQKALAPSTKGVPVTVEEEALAPPPLPPAPHEPMDLPFDSRNLNNVIGAGGGAGGGFGGKYGRRGGRAGGRAHQKAVDAGELWLNRLQHECGLWVEDDATPPTPDDVRASALAALVYLAQGHTTNVGQHRSVVKNAIRALGRAQHRSSGQVPAPLASLNPDARVPAPDLSARALEAHAYATMALVEAWHLCGDPLFKRPAQRAVDFLLAHEKAGQWGESTLDADARAVLSGVALLSLLAARDAGLTVDPAALDRAVDSMRFRREGASPTVTGVSLLARILAGEDPDSPELEPLTRQLLAHLPTAHDDALATDPTYLHYASMALWQVSGQAWATWASTMQNAVVKTQTSNGNDVGCWVKTGTFAEQIADNALITLSLTVYYRYDRIFGHR